MEIGQLMGNLTYEEERINELIARKERMITKRDQHKRDLDDHELLIQDCQEMLVQIQMGQILPEYWEIFYNIDFP